MKIQDVHEKANAVGLVAVEQRGFYSHFVRIRTPDYRTIGTIDVSEDGDVPEADVERLIRQAPQAT